MIGWPHHLGHRLAKVIAVYPGRHRVDVICIDNGQRLAQIKVMGHVASDAGSWRVPSVPKPASDARADALSPTGRNLIAVVGLVSGRPLVLGFVQPNGTQMTFKEDNRFVDRHPSGAYTTTAPDGSMEVFHPGGGYVRVGAGDHQDLAAVSADGNWTIPAGGAPPQITVATAGVKLTIMPNGAILLDAPGSPLTIHVQQTQINGPVTINGDLLVNGQVSSTGDMIANGVSLEHHTNGGKSVP